jgi:hypothetical protein
MMLSKKVWIKVRVGRWWSFEWSVIDGKALGVKNVADDDCCFRGTNLSLYT